MKRLAASVAVAALGLALGVSPAQAFDFKDLDLTFTSADGSPQMQAGAHPFAVNNTLAIATVEDPKTGNDVPEAEVESMRIDFPPGLVADPSATPQCSSADFATIDAGTKRPACQDSAAVGLAEVDIGFGIPDTFTYPVYNLVPAPGKVAKLGFVVDAGGVPVTIDLGFSTEPPYHGVASLSGISQVVGFYGSRVSVWGNPGDPAYDEERGECGIDGGSVVVGSCPTGAPNRPFLTLPRACTGPLVTSFAALAWNTGDTAFGEAITHDDGSPPSPLGLGGCGKLGFAPRLVAKPTATAAESPSGLDVSLEVHDEGIASPSGLAQSDIKRVRLTLPEGVTANPSLAEGLGVCSQAQLAAEQLSSPPGAGCPPASKVGTLEVETPLLEGKLLKGSLYIAAPYDNPFGSLLALYMVIRDPGLGIIVKQAGKIEPDPRSGRLVSTFDDLPQVPLERVFLHLREGGRSPLVTPPACGSYTTVAELTPWANPKAPHTTTSSFEVTAGPNGGQCPPGAVPPFAPGFEAGSTNNAAGSYSPFNMRLTRRDGDQDMTRFSAVLPPGMTGKIAGLTRCPEAAIAAAKTRSGRAELASPSCPASSEIGRTLSGAGVGSELTYVSGKLYLAGPFGGKPLSVVAIVPAVAGPFDVGTVVVREALTLNPVTAEVEVDGAASDPIPHILAGIPLKIRDIRVHADRPQFTLNPTSCDPSAVRATLFGGWLDVFSSADDATVSLAARFQAAGCRGLGFKPKVAINLRGGTRRGAHPALKAVVTPRPGDANFGSAVVTLPPSAFLEQSHIRTICTRVQFAADSCPAGAVYGEAKAWTPLLEEPLSGPVYLRASRNPLPDLVADLRGIVKIEVASRIDSVNGRIRSSFESIPDAPVSKFVLSMRGGKKGLIVNSANLCRGVHRGKAALTGQNGRVYRFKPVVRATGCAKKGKRPGRR